MGLLSSAASVWALAMSAAVQDAEAFCRQTLCNTQLAAYLNSTFVCWGGDIRQPDAYRLSNRHVLSALEAREPYVLP